MCLASQLNSGGTSRLRSCLALEAGKQVLWVVQRVGIMCLALKEASGI
jgi:hypothetical protein